MAKPQDMAEDEEEDVSVQDGGDRNRPESPVPQQKHPSLTANWFSRVIFW